MNNNDIEITDKDYFELFENNPLGSAILNQLVGNFYDIKSFDPNNQYNTAFREGQRHVIRHILARIMMAQDEQNNNDE